MREEYIIHTRDALALVKHMASNREFDGKWHTSPFEEFKESGERRWSDFMSGHWSWKEAVRNTSLGPGVFAYIFWDRTTLLEILTHTALCLCRSSSVQTRRPFPSPPDIKNSIPYTYPLVTSTTTCGARTVMPSFLLLSFRSRKVCIISLTSFSQY